MWKKHHHTEVKIKNSLLISFYSHFFHFAMTRKQFLTIKPYDDSSIVCKCMIYCTAFFSVLTFETRFRRAAIVGINRRSRQKASFTARTRLRSRSFRFSILCVFVNGLVSSIANSFRRDRRIAMLSRKTINVCLYRS